MYIFSTHIGHDGAFSIAKDNELLVHCQFDRFNRQKGQETTCSNFFYYLSSLNIKFDIVLITDLNVRGQEHIFHEIFWTNFLKRFNLTKKETEFKFYINDKTRHHHLYHAYCSKATLGNNKNYVVIDGAGSLVEETNNLESESLYNNDFKKIKVTSDGLGHSYSHVTGNLLQEPYIFAFQQCGKTMALSQYGNKKVGIDNILKNKLTTLKNDKNTQNILYTFQKTFEKKIKEKMPLENVNYTGGCAQNILANSNFLNYNNFKIDPICTDSGISIGLLNFYLKGKLKKINSVYLGPKPNYDYLYLFKEYKISDSDENKVSEILKDNPVALFQGRSEQGQRGLGNRSLLINPDNKNAIKKINAIKKREWYRPFSPSIIEEEASNYFNIDKNFSSPYMLYTFKNKIPLPNVSAIDGSSRIQTVNKKQNKNYYNLLKASGSILLNTSLNFPGHVIVETLIDLKYMMDNSTLKYAWLPDIKKLIEKK